MNAINTAGGPDSYVFVLCTLAFYEEGRYPFEVGERAENKLGCRAQMIGERVPYDINF